MFEPAWATGSVEGSSRAVQMPAADRASARETSENRREAPTAAQSRPRSGSVDSHHLGCSGFLSSKGPPMAAGLWKSAHASRGHPETHQEQDPKGPDAISTHNSPHEVR